MTAQVSGPILVVDLFADLHARLLSLLRSFGDDDWQLPTVCSGWCVKDIAAHLLDTDLRRLSAQRDRYCSPSAPGGFESPADLVNYLHELNAVWTRAADRLSPAVLIELLKASHPRVIKLFRSLDPAGRAIYPVAWAGESESANWFDVAREYTERWHHQAQIRMAVNRMDDLLSAHLYRSVLDTFIRALPYTFRDRMEPAGTLIEVVIEGDAGGTWSLVSENATWKLYEGARDGATARTIIPADAAWRVFTKRLTAETARARFPDIRLEGNRELAGRVLEMISIMA